MFEILSELPVENGALGAYGLSAMVRGCNGADCSLYGTIGCLAGCVLSGGVSLAAVALGGNGVMAAVVIATSP